MTTIRIPTPLRPYTDGLKEIIVEGETVGMLIQEVASRYPQIQPHLFDENGDLRAYVNIFLNHEDVRLMDGDDTQVRDDDNLMIVPSIAGGSTTIDSPPLVDHAALRTNQASIISLLLIAFIIDLPVLAIIVALIMLSGTVTKKPGFFFVYQGINRLGLVKPEVLPDHPEPHQFAQGFGAVVLLLSFSSASFGFFQLAWILVWVVVVLAGVNLFFGFCVGCAMYYWFNRIGLPFSHLDPPGDRIPGARPPKEQ